VEGPVHVSDEAMNRSLVYGGFGRMCERATASNSRPSPDLSP
jgi:hypothetical protein